MKETAKRIYAFCMLGLMLFGIFRYGGGSLSAARSLVSGFGDVAGELLSGSASGLGSVVSSLSSGGSPTPLAGNVTSQPQSQAAASQSTAAPTAAYVSTGMDGLVVYPYGRTLLSAAGQAAYDTVQAGLLNMQKSIAVTSSLSSTEMQTVVEYVLRDHPEIFYQDKTSLYYTRNLLSSSTKYTVRFTYSYTAAQVAAMRQKISAAAAPMLAKAAKETDAVKKEQALHDALIENCAYNEAAAQTPDSYPKAYTAYGALAEGSAVCDGYARAMKLLLDSAGLHSLYVTGTAASGGSSGPHAWNFVYVGAWYQLDATFDDPVYKNAAGKVVEVNEKSYTYFNFTQKADHVLGTYDASDPFSASSENYAAMPAL